MIRLYIYVIIYITILQYAISSQQNPHIAQPFHRWRYYVLLHVPSNIIEWFALLSWWFNTVVFIRRQKATYSSVLSSMEVYCFTTCTFQHHWMVCTTVVIIWYSFQFSKITKSHMRYFQKPHIAQSSYQW